MSNLDRKRKRGDNSPAESSVREVKPEPNVIDLDEYVDGKNNTQGNIAGAPADNASSVDLDSYNVVADRNQEMIKELMKIPGDLREEMAVKANAVRTDVTTSMVEFTKEMHMTLDETKQDLKRKVEGYHPRLTQLEEKTTSLDTTVKDLDKKVDKRIKTAQNEANKDHGVNIKAQVKEEVNECLRGFGDYLTNYFAKNGAPNGSVNDNAQGRLPPRGVFPPRAAATSAATATATATRANAAAPAATATVTRANATAPATASAPLIPFNFAPEAVPLLAMDQFMPYQVLTNKGYHTLLQTIKFTDINHLVQLLKLDNDAIARKCIMFTDLKFPLYNIDYVLHSGGHAVRHMGHNTGTARPGGHDQAHLLRHVNLSPLRLMKMKIDPRVMLHDEQVRYTTWERRWQPPAYVYDLGELVLRKRSTRVPYPTTGLLTPYNLLLEVAKAGGGAHGAPTSRRVWIVMSPQHELTRRQHGSTKDSNWAFNGLEQARLALLAHNVADLQFDRGDFEGSGAGFEAAHRLVLESLCPGLPAVDFNKNVNLKQFCNEMA